ncbi:MAG: hypothetical protein RLZZ69_2340 [Cyanobacteriota bacterium]
MLDNYKSIPFLAGLCLLFITPLSLGAFVYSSFRADVTEQSSETAEDSTEQNDSLGGLTTESNIKTAPSPLPESGSGVSNTDSTTGIPTGKYSNPPTTLETGSDGLIPQTSQEPIDNFDNLGSSVDRNQAIQQTINDPSDSIDSSAYSTPDYSSPSSSNNYNDTQDNSLIQPAENDSLLETPESDSLLEPPTENDSLFETPESDTESVPFGSSSESSESLSQP